MRCDSLGSMARRQFVKLAPIDWAPKHCHARHQILHAWQRYHNALPGSFFRGLNILDPAWSPVGGDWYPLGAALSDGVPGTPARL